MCSIALTVAMLRLAGRNSGMTLLPCEGMDARRIGNKARRWKVHLHRWRRLPTGTAASTAFTIE